MNALLLRIALLLLALPAAAHADTLAQLVTAALEAHPAVLAQRAHASAAQANAKSARWQFFPTPSVAVEGVQASGGDSSHQGDDAVTILRLQQPLWTGGRLRAESRRAKAGVESGEAAIEVARLQIALEAVESYGSWLSAHLKTQAYEKSRSVHSDLRALVERRIVQGASAQSDLILAVGRLDGVSADLSAARAQREAALAGLGQTVGHPVDSESLASEIAVPRPVGADSAALLAKALAIHPVFRKARAEARGVEAAVGVHRAAFFPEVFARGERQYGNLSYGGASAVNRIVFGVNTQFGAGLSSFSNLENARQQHRAALAEADAQSRIVSRQVLADHAQALSLLEREAALRSSADAASQVIESFNRQFLAGRKSWLDVMNSARDLAQIEAQLADVQGLRVVVTWRLAVYAQGPTAITVRNES